jgi:hypothetical protein
MPDEDRPLVKIGSLVITGSYAGAIVALGIAAICWFGIPSARPFIIGSVGLGVILGLILWWKHR